MSTSENNDPMAGSVTQLLARFVEGDQHAAQKLWRQYFDRLAAVARRKLAGAPRKHADEEDVVIQAFAC